ncbi:Putative liporotein LppU [Mycobacteroides abscessus subsp. bolletii]|nr:Putative liporotein LppU [Mycobacteroides abscessus subsp. bolletii]
MNSKSLFAVAFPAIFMVACQNASTPPATSTTPTAAGINFADIPGEFASPASTTQAGAEEAPVGACVKVTGNPREAGLRRADCGGPDATHRIIQRVTTPDECVSDIDRRFYQNTAAGEWTACLDIYWAFTDCLSITDAGTRRVSCHDESVQPRIRPTKLVLDAKSVDVCPEGGYEHPQRRFTVCTETQK